MAGAVFRGVTILLLTLQPSMASTSPVCTKLVDVSSTTQANKAFWTNHCSQLPTSATMVRVDMGAVKDYFKPKHGVTLCAMLTSSSKHMWSPDGHSWETPYYPNGGAHFGGSEGDWLGLITTQIIPQIIEST